YSPHTDNACSNTRTSPIRKLREQARTSGDSSARTAISGPMPAGAPMVTAKTGPDRVIALPPCSQDSTLSRETLPQEETHAPHLWFGSFAWRPHAVDGRRTRPGIRAPRLCAAIAADAYAGIQGAEPERRRAHNRR